MTDNPISPPDLMQARQRTGRKRPEVALEAGISRAYLNGIELGLYTPSPELAYRLAGVLKCEPSVFILAERKAEAS